MCCCIAPDGAAGAAGAAGTVGAGACTVRWTKGAVPAMPECCIGSIGTAPSGMPAATP